MGDHKGKQRSEDVREPENPRPGPAAPPPHKVCSKCHGGINSNSKNTLCYKCSGVEYSSLFPEPPPHYQHPVAPRPRGPIEGRTRLLLASALPPPMEGAQAAPPPRKAARRRRAPARSVVLGSSPEADQRARAKTAGRTGGGNLSAGASGDQRASATTSAGGDMGDHKQVETAGGDHGYDDAGAPTLRRGGEPAENARSDQLSAPEPSKKRRRVMTGGSAESLKEAVLQQKKDATHSSTPVSNLSAGAFPEPETQEELAAIGGRIPPLLLLTRPEIQLPGGISSCDNVKNVPRPAPVADKLPGPGVALGGRPPSLGQQLPGGNPGVQHGGAERPPHKLCPKHGETEICVRCAFQGSSLPKLWGQKLMYQPAGFVGQCGEAPGVEELAVQFEHPHAPQAHPAAGPGPGRMSLSRCPYCQQPTPMRAHPLLHVCLCYHCAPVIGRSCPVCGLGVPRR